MTLTATSLALPSHLNGYKQYDDYLAQETRQGSRLHYTIVVPLPQVAMILPVPDPAKPFADNRQVRVRHAQDFADYVRTNDYWHSGPLTVRTTSGVVHFKAFDGGTYGDTLRVGLLQVPRNAPLSFRIVDGQHRVLGTHLLLQQINADLLKQRGLLAKAKQNGDPASVVKQFSQAVEVLERTLARVTADSLGIDLIIEDDPARARQLFVEVANNALGITKTVTRRFDTAKVVNRALNQLLDDPAAPDLVRNHVDHQNDRVTGNNPNLVGASHLADLVQIVEIGIGTKVSPALEARLDEHLLVKKAKAFLQVLQNGFPDIEAITLGTKTPSALRSKSIVVSTTMLKVLAGVYHDLRAAGRTDAEVEKFFKKLARHSSAPVVKGTPSGDLWIGATTSDAFSDGVTAPGARTQQVKELTRVITTWFDSPPTGL